MGFAVGCSEWDGGGKKRLRPMRGGSGARAWGVPTDRRAAAVRQRPKTDGAHTAGRTEGEGEADGWAAATVSGGGDADERGPSGSGRGREGHEWLTGARGPAREEKGVVEPR
jgi:hypothetical protein